MQRNRQDEIALGQQTASASFKPAREGWRKIESVGMLQSQNRTPALRVIAHDGARLVESRGPCQARCAERDASRVQLEGKPATVAHRSIEKLNLLPALRTQAAGIPHQRPTSHAKRRKKKIDQRQNICSIAPRICLILTQWQSDHRAYSTAMPSHCTKRAHARWPARCFWFVRPAKDW